jgi:hypothetical protein
MRDFRTRVFRQTKRTPCQSADVRRLIRLFDSVAKFPAREAFGHDSHAEVMIAVLRCERFRASCDESDAHIGYNCFPKRSPGSTYSRFERVRRGEFISL